MNEFWSYAIASCIGTSHLKQGSRKDDVCRAFIALEHRKIFVGIVCDGAGSARWGGVGAWLTTDVFNKNCRNFFLQNKTFPSDDLIWSWVDEARDRINKLATSRSAQLSDFATTLIVTMSDGDNTLIAHIGDGAVVARNNDDQQWNCLSWPAHGEYASTTRFITENGTPDLRITRIDRSMDALFLFSDGLERLALDFKVEKPFSPFFEQMIKPLQNNEEFGFLQNLSRSLLDYLNSDKINNRTDDDKSIIIASIKK